MRTRHCHILFIKNFSPTLYCNVPVKLSVVGESMLPLVLPRTLITAQSQIDGIVHIYLLVFLSYCWYHTGFPTSVTCLYILFFPLSSCLYIDLVLSIMFCRVHCFKCYITVITGDIHHRTVCVILWYSFIFQAYSNLNCTHCV